MVGREVALVSNSCCAFFNPCSIHPPHFNTKQTIGLTTILESIQFVTVLYSCLFTTTGSTKIERKKHYDLRKHYFSPGIVNIWNSLPNTVVDASTVNTFKARLDKFWLHQLVKFDFTADLTGTGNRSGVVIS